MLHIRTRLKPLALIMVMPLCLSACSLFYQYTPKSSGDPSIIFGDQHQKDVISRQFFVNIDPQTNQSCFAYKSIGTDLSDNWMENTIGLKPTKTISSPPASIAIRSFAIIPRFKSCETSTIRFTPESNSKYSIDVVNVRPIEKDTNQSDFDSHRAQCDVSVDKILPNGTRIPVDVETIAKCN